VLQNIMTSRKVWCLFKKCLKNTIVLPLYNGVDTKKLLVLYQIMSFAGMCLRCFNDRISRVIRKIGDFEETTFGSHSAPMSRLKSCINFVKSRNRKWSCYWHRGKSVGEICFISALASTTSYLDENIGQIIASDSRQRFCKSCSMKLQWLQQ
jgi:2-dehydropantoate 2-reductase